MSEFQISPNAKPIAADLRAAMLQDPGFGRVFTDHMVVIEWNEAKGWHDARVEARGPLSIDPACAVLHYAQEIFEGLKAYRVPSGDVVLFRPDANARRFNESAERMAMPSLPEDTFVEALEQLIRIDRDWIPEGEGSLYLRPFMFGSETFLGVKPSAEYKFIVIASSVGAYFKGGKPGISVWLSEHYTRAARGGTGAAKCGGNYASSLIAQKEAIGHGCDQVVFLDAVEQRWVEELGGMNTFFVMDDGSLVTPPLGGTILPGITRDSLLTLARAGGITVREERYAIDQWLEDARSGRLREAFACGTAAVITPIVEVRGQTHNFTIGNGGPGIETMRLRDALTAIQRGTAPDPHGWVRPVR
ncbi:branched-chain amino acid aminotransferase [Sphingomonas solaris]|uniref:Probable branched-chain-amino-acid aminotransferase n=1 Tax=Alterirhizorhabdus solaris TaxID=2529389 RepID=A0A558R9Q7_9SPHN|nr:branched-chain amino acid aminotransferase [Sphingomonas solaris]TVV76123.1 branched-chain amino acid aminotransferase [Sphingomonas solaris]